MIFTMSKTFLHCVFQRILVRCLKGKQRQFLDLLTQKTFKYWQKQGMTTKK